MRAKSLILFVIAIGCGLAASIGVSQYMETASGTVSKVETAEILVALTDIGISESLDARTVKLEEWPQDRVPEGAVLALADVDGKYARARLYAGEPILLAKLMDSNKGSPTVTIPKGYRAVPVKVSAETAGGLIQPGDRVDVLVILRKSAEVQETGTRTILRDVNVFAVDGATERAVDEEGRARTLNTVMLLLKPQQAEGVMLAHELGRLFLTLRRPDDDAEDSSDGETVKSLLGYSGENANENKQPEDSGFAGWLNTAVNTAQQQVQDITAAATPIEKPKWEMEILGPSGSTNFHWLDEDELPVQGRFGETPPPSTPGASPLPYRPVTPTVPLTAPQPPARRGPPTTPPETSANENEEESEGNTDQAVVPQ